LLLGRVLLGLVNVNSHSSTEKLGVLISAAIVLVLFVCEQNNAQIGGSRQVPANQPQTSDNAGHEGSLQAEQELRNGTDLTRRGLFREAIPHLLAAHGQVSNEYAAEFNLALCYVGTSQFKQAIDLLKTLSNGSHAADVENLLAQADIGNGQPQEALTAFQRAVSLTPQNEKLYLLVADACTNHHDYALGIKVVELGLHNLPQSARLHYERALFLAQVDDLDHAKADFSLAGKLAPGSDIGYLAAAQEALLEGNIAETVRVAREGAEKNSENHALLTILGEALVRSGASPGQPEFAEAEAALEKSVVIQPADATSHLSLGELYLLAGRLADAIVQLQQSQQIDPSKPAVYANLAKAYQRRGDLQNAQDALAVLAKLNQAQADRISSAPGDRKVSYGGKVKDEDPPH
jgi:tetratricopeptide (TPR) repeat protein